MLVTFVSCVGVGGGGGAGEREKITVMERIHSFFVSSSVLMWGPVQCIPSTAGENTVAYSNLVWAVALREECLVI